MGEVGYDEELHVAGNMVTWRKEVKAFGQMALGLQPQVVMASCWLNSILGHFSRSGPHLSFSCSFYTRKKETVAPLGKERIFLVFLLGRVKM